MCKEKGHTENYSPRHTSRSGQQHEEQTQAAPAVSLNSRLTELWAVEGLFLATKFRDGLSQSSRPMISEAGI